MAYRVLRIALKALTRLFPRAFRDSFSDEIIEQMELDVARAYERSALAALWYALGAALDIVKSAIAERRNPTWVAPYNIQGENARMPSFFENWAREIRQAMRSLARSPGFTVVTVLTLGLAIGANAGMFSVVNRVLFNPLPYPNADRIVYIAATAPGSDFPAEFGLSSEFYVQYKEQSKLLEDLSTYNSGTSTFRTDDRVERIRMSWPTNSLYSTLGAKPMYGRLPVTEDGDRVFVASYAMWNSWFGNDTSVIGRTYEVSGAQRTLIGIMPPSFRFPEDGTQLWISNTIRADSSLVPGRFGSFFVGRMTPQATPEALARELTTLASRLPERFGGTANYARLIGQHRAVVRTIESELLGAVARPLKVLLGAVAIVLLIACANVVNLFSVRAESRQRDLAVRRALGAARSQLIRLQIAEAVVVAGLAGALATLLAFLSLPALLRAAPRGIPRIEDVGVDAPTVAFTLAAALVSAIACGIVPAVRASAPQLSKLREGGRSSTRGRRFMRDGLVAAQTALALVLLIGSGLLIRSFWELRHVNPGYNTKNIFTFQIAPEGASLTDGAAYARFDMDFLDRLAALPGVQSVGLIENVPLNETPASMHFRTEGANAGDAGTMLSYTYTAGDYFKTMGIRMTTGRMFARNEQLGASGLVIVSKSAAARLWPGADPVGKRIQRQGSTNWDTVIGVVDDVLQRDFRETPDPLLYYPLVGPPPRSWTISSPAYVVKSTRAQTIAPEIRALVKEIAPIAPMYRQFTLEGLAEDSMVQLSFTMLTLGITSMLALILGAVGLCGVLSYVVAERTREIGLRMALGARTDQVRRMVVVQGARVVGIGVAVGVAVAIGSARLLNSLLFGVAALDVATFVAMSGSMMLIGLLASYVPARRASNVDPIASLRSE